MTDETKVVPHATIIQGMVGRFKSLPFKNKGQMVAFKKALNVMLDEHISEKANGWNKVREKAAAAKTARKATMQSICGRWAVTQLKPGDVIKITGKKSSYIVMLVEPERIAAREVTGNAAVDFTPPIHSETIINPVTVEKIYHEGTWLDIYKLASGK
jgi:hypothetical protein